jgi:polysaccharide deacetylase family protein (PEP-CTERM system associated)
MKTYLFSIDLEDVRLWMPDGQKYAPRVPINTHKYLDWLRGHNATCTFFCVGQVAELYPSLIQEIVAEGHEVALHSHTHAPINQQTQEAFRADLHQNLEALYRAGSKDIVGYRAPIFSLTQETAWAYPLLAQAGITYSSSVLPAANPLYGWAGFGQAPRQTENVWELPMTVGRLGGMHLPFAGGTYLRLLPTFLAKGLFAKAQNPVLGYAHPYDLDTEQERFMHPGIGGSPLYNQLMYLGRAGFLDKLDALLATGAQIMPYRQWLAQEGNLSVQPI